MQKGKHQGGQTQGYPPRSYSTYPGNPETSRQYSRGEVPAFHASGTPGGGPGMRAMHHQPPTQPPTPPSSQEMKQPPAHLPPQPHQIPPQSGGQIVQYTMPGTGRGSTQQPPYFGPRAPPGNQRMASHARTSLLSMSNNAQPFMSQPVAPVFPGHVVSGQTPMFINQSFQMPQPRHQSGAFFPPQILLPQHHVFAHYTQQPMYFAQPLQTMPRAGGPAPSSQGGAPAQPQPPLALITSHGGPMISNPGVSQQVKARPRNRLPIIDPKDGRNVLEDMKENDNTSSRSGESSARQTPQPNAGQKTDQGVAADFATLVVKAAMSDHSGSPNSSALQQSSSRTSNYSESESQASPDPQGMSTPSVSPSKLDTSVESISSESQIVENNITYDTNQQASIMRSGWTPYLQGNMPVELLPMPIHPMMIADDMMRTGPIPSQPQTREHDTFQRQALTVGNSVLVNINKEPAAQIESQVRPAPERVTPVVSALAHAPTVDLGPRPQREQFPALGKSHQLQSPMKKKRSEQTQEQGDGKAKDQQSKTVTQSKVKPVTPTVENKKQPTQPSQDNDEYVQSVQTKNNEPKTIIIKKNDSDSSVSKTKPNDCLKNKESNNVETRNLNEEIVEDSSSRIKSENAKCEILVSKESSPASTPDESVSKLSEEVHEDVEFVPEAEIISTPAEDSAPLKTNGETVEEDAKSNNQKSKHGNKRPAQSKMKLESKDLRNAEPETPAIEAATSAPSVPETKTSAPSTAITNEQSEKPQEESTVNEEKQKDDLIVAAKNEENNKQMTSTSDATSTPTVPNKVVLKHTYDVDQWSPLNPEGKKKYDRDFILGLQKEPHSLRKPNNFPSLELLNDNNKQRPFDRNAINSMSRGNIDVIYPSFAKNSSQRGGQPVTKRGSQQGKPKAAKPPVLQYTLQQDVKLHETENAWKSTRKTESTNRTEEEAKTEYLYKRVRGILNKLTPEKFDKLVKQVQSLPIDTSTRLAGVIDLVFKKAVDEPSFSVAYAQMCSVLQKIEVPSNQIKPDGKPEPENFRKLLLGRCQALFEKNTAAELKRDERLSEIEQEKDPEKKKALQLTFEEEERRIRMKSVGNIRFIGELYKMNMLTCNIMHNCIKHLLKQGDEESLECLCKLLTTIGQGLDNNEKANKSNSDGKDLNSYFNDLSDIVKNGKDSGKVSSRVRFMIQDLIDLRKSNWVPRRNESQPQKMDQIQKEAERENEMNLALNSPQERNRRQDMRNSMENRKRGGPDSSGWTTVQQNKSRYVIEYAKLKLDQNDTSTFSLGNRNQFMWGQGGSTGKADEKRSSSQLGSNKFALLSPSSGNTTLKGSSVSDKDRVNSYKSLDDEVRSSASQQDSRSSSKESSSSKRDDSRFVSYSNKSHLPPPQPSAPVDDATKEEISKKAKLILEEYVICLDVNEAYEDTKDYISPSIVELFVTSLCLEGMEMRDSNAKKAVKVLMSHFISRELISKDQFIAGLSKVLETADDLAIDMPLVWEYVAEIVVDMCAEDVITFKDLETAITPIQGTLGSAKFLSALMKQLKATKDEKWLEQKWISSDVNLVDIIDKKDVKDFVKQNGVDFTVKDYIKKELLRLITAKASFDEITAWVTENLGSEISSEPSFVRILMTVLLEASVTKGQSSSYKLDLDVFAYYEQLIVRYTHHLESLELPCLYAVQAFLQKLDFPLAILHSIFNRLWDVELIALETFKKWRDAGVNEQKGHAICVKSLTSFFTHLDEVESDDES